MGNALATRSMESQINIELNMQGVMSGVAGCSTGRATAAVGIVRLKSAADAPWTPPHYRGGVVADVSMGIWRCCCQTRAGKRAHSGQGTRASKAVGDVPSGGGRRAEQMLQAKLSAEKQGCSSFSSSAHSSAAARETFRDNCKSAK